MEVFVKSLDQMWETFQEIWPCLLLSVVISAAMRRYVNGARVNQWLQKYRSTSIVAATSVAVSTPLCSCGGGIAVSLSMMAASIPWGPHDDASACSYSFYVSYSDGTCRLDVQETGSVDLPRQYGDRTLDLLCYQNA